MPQDVCGALTAQAADSKVFKILERHVLRRRLAVQGQLRVQTATARVCPLVVALHSLLGPDDFHGWRAVESLPATGPANSPLVCKKRKNRDNY